MTLAGSLVEDLRPDDPQLRRYLARIDRLTGQLGRLEDEQVRRALSLLTDARRRLLDELASLPTDARGSLQAVMLQNLQAMLDREAQRFAADYRRDLTDALGRAWGLGSELAPDTLATMGVTLPLRPQLSRVQFEVAQGYVADLIRRVSDDFRDRVSQRLRLGILGGENVASLQRKIAADLRTQPSRTVPGLGPVAAQAERITRTELQTIYAIANDQRQGEIAGHVPGIRKLWVTAHDSRVRPDHATAGQRYAPGGTPGPIPYQTPFRVGGERADFPHDPKLSAAQRINCRCVAPLWHADWERLKAQVAR